jgi:hypothetical protein
VDDIAGAHHQHTLLAQWSEALAKLQVILGRLTAVN